MTTNFINKLKLNRFYILAFIFYLFVILLSGCGAQIKNDEQEGGITGTGFKIDCNLDINKKRKECLNKGINKTLR